MKFLLTMNQIAYFKPETTARRLKNYYYQENGDPVIFLGYLRLIRHLPHLAARAKAFRPELYHNEVRAIFLETPWETTSSCWLRLFLREFREFFTAAEWHQLKIRYQKSHPFLGMLLFRPVVIARAARIAQVRTSGSQFPTLYPKRSIIIAEAALPLAC